jgi:spermidine synthase
MIYLFLIGFISILGQVVLLRELIVAFYGIELIYSLALGMWLLCTATGTWIGRKDASRFRVAFLLGLFSILLPLEVAFIRDIRLVFSGVPGAYLPFQSQILAMLLSTLPMGLLLGLLFRSAAGRFMIEGRTLALAYSIESAGGIAGGLCATLFFRFGSQNFTIALICSLIALVPALVLAASSRTRPWRWAWGIPAACLIWLLSQNQLVDRWMTSWAHPHLVATRDSPYSRITVSRLGSQLSVFENDALSFETEGTGAEEFVHLAALQHARPARVLILGGGTAGLIREIEKHDPAQVDYVELNPAYVSLVESQLPGEYRDSLHRSCVRIRYKDPRTVSDEGMKYDLILVGMPEPASGQANRFYTLEFFRECRARLAAGGLMSFRLRSSENYWTPQLTRRMVSIYRAARSSFREVVVLPGTTNIFLCSDLPLPRDPQIPAERLKERHIAAQLVSPAYITYLYTNDRFAQVADILDSGTAPANTDTRPICYQYTLMLWLSKFFPSLAGLDLSQISWPSFRQAVPEWSIFIVALGLFFIYRRRERLRRPMLVGTTAFLGMVLETLLLLHYQVKNGVLFQDLGVLLMSFMAGLAAGAFALDRMMGWGGAGHRGKSKSLGIGLVGLFVPLAGWIVFRSHANAEMRLPETAILLAISGFLVSAVFAYASMTDSGPSSGSVAPLYSADLIGGCFGSLLASLILVPLFGLTNTSLWMIPVVLLAALLV